MALEYAQAAVKSMSPEPKMKDSFVATAPCSGPSDDQVADQVMYEHWYTLDGLDITYNNQVLQAVKSYWKGQSFTIATDMEPSNGRQWDVSAKNQSTQFKMEISERNDGVVYLGVQSPCVYDPGTGNTSITPSSLPFTKR